MTRALRGIVVGTLGILLAVVACTSIPLPLARPEDPDAAPGDGGAASDARLAFDASRCRGGGWRSLRGNGLILDGDKAGTQMLAASGSFAEPDAGQVVYELLVTGIPAQLVGQAPVDLATDANADLATCAYCGLALANCVPISPEAIRCDDNYQAIAGEARAVSIPTVDGGKFWVEVGNLVLARVVRREGFAVVERDDSDCIALERLTLEGTALRITRPCSPAYELYCRVADTASAR